MENEYYQEKIKELQKVLIDQSRLAQLGEMINIISHQWKQPLNTIVAIIQNLRDANDFDEFSEELLIESCENIIKSVKQMTDSMNAFRNFSKLGRITKNVNLKELIQKTLELIEWDFKQNNIILNLNLNEECYFVGFPNEISQIILNILNNAKDAITKKSTFGSGKVKINLFHENNKEIISISNNAGEISNEIIGKIFEKDFTTKTENNGNGLGLYIAKMIISKMDGDISVRNIKNKEGENGVEFIITIPSSE
jgi:signal transduction histidine kinase